METVKYRKHLKPAAFCKVQVTKLAWTQTYLKFEA